MKALLHTCRHTKFHPLLSRSFQLWCHLPNGAIRRKLNKTDLRTLLVAVDNKWRGQRKLNKTTKNFEPVPSIKNAYFIYTFLIDIPVIYQRITNGEKVLIQSDTARELNCHHLHFGSSNPVHLSLNPMGFELKW